MVVVCGGLVQISECLPTIFTKPLLFCDRGERGGGWRRGRLATPILARPNTTAPKIIANA